MTNQQYAENKEYNIHFQLTPDEAKTFESCKTRIGCSDAGAIICLIRGALMQKSELHNNAFQDLLDDKVLEKFDKDFDTVNDVIRCLCQRDEKQDEQIADLEIKFDRLTKIVKDVLDLAELSNLESKQRLNVSDIKE